MVVILTPIVLMVVGIPGYTYPMILRFYMIFLGGNYSFQGFLAPDSVQQNQLWRFSFFFLFREFH